MQTCGADSALIYKNIDDALDFNIEKNKILKNVMFSELNKPEYISEPLTNWIDFNWVIIKNNVTNNFEFVVGMMKDNPIELGLKHTMIGFKNDLYLAGEGRIIKNHIDNKFYIQLNLNSSSWDINSYKHRLRKCIDRFTLSDDEKNSAIKEFIALKLDEIINKIKNSDTNLDFQNAIVQITDLTLKRTLYGDLDQTNTFYNPIINNSIVNDGLLYYYKDNTDGCPPDTLIKNAHEYAKTNNKLYEIYPKIIKSQNKDYIHIDDVLVKINPIEKIKNEYTGLTKLELLDKNISDNGRKIYPVYGIPLFDLIPFGADEFFSNYIEPKLITEFDFDKQICRHQHPSIYSPKNIEYKNLKCFKAQGAGSGAYIIELNGTKILKGNQFVLKPNNDDDLLQKFKFILEAWVNDILRRNVYAIPKLCDNFVKVNDIFVCENKLPHENPIVNNNCENNYLRIANDPTKTKVFGFISMEIIDGTLGNFIDKQLMFDYGMFFEYLYGKLVAYINTNIIFTDQANTGNCGYKTVDYCRKYTLQNNGSNIVIYVKNKYMIKILDFDNIKISNPSTDKNIYHNVSDITQVEDKIQYELDIARVKKIMSESHLLKHTNIHEKDFCVNLLQIQIQNFKNKNQIPMFIKSIIDTLPPDYRIPPPVGIPIQEFEFKWY
jgi:hypothetical protein